MSYIGSTPTTQSFIAGTDSFNGTGSQTDFTLSRLVNSVNDVQVVVNNVVQYPPNYSVSGNTLTISPAPSAGTDNVYVRYLSTTLQSITVPGGSTVVGGFNVTGNVGIGQPSPTYLIEALANGSGANLNLARFAATSSATGGSTAGINIIALSNLISLTTETSDNLAFGTNGVERARITSAGLFQFNSGYGSVATAYGCRAWVNFNGTGTVAIRASGNVSSITDNGTGDYTVNFATAMPDANYQYSGTGKRNSATHRPVVISQANTATYDSITTSFRFLTWVEAAAAVEDPLAFNVTVFR
jgi:hypothetical protein